MKSNLLIQSDKNCTIFSNSNQEPVPISSHPKPEPVPISSPLPTRSQSATDQSKPEQDSGIWKKAPFPVSTTEKWEKTSKKKKHKNLKFRNSPCLEEIPDFEDVPKIEQSLPPKDEIIKHKNKTAEDEKNPTSDDGEKEESATPDNIEQEKKKRRRRKNKQSSEDPEDDNVGYRVVIRDDQIEINPPQFARRSSETAHPLLDKAKTPGYCEFLVINELGSGISKGCMNYGRLYQGKYIPPERTDALIPECKDDDGASEEKSDEVIVEDALAKPSADIALD